MKRKKREETPSRPRFAEEARLPWLPLLLAAQAAVDAGVAAGVRERERRGGRPACRRGCSVCCRAQADIAVFPLELVGLSWYAVEKLEGPAREAVRAQLAAHARGGPCPFLVGGACAAYPVRPMACRSFTVFGAPCAEGEDPWHARRADVLDPQPAALERARRAMLPFHGVDDRGEQDLWIARGLLDTLARSLPQLDWRSLARKMEEHDARPPAPEAPMP